METNPNPIILSLADDDYYKLTVNQFIFSRYREVRVRYEFRCRSTPAFPLALLLEAVEAEIDHLCNLSFTSGELAYLRRDPNMLPSYLSWLRGFRLPRGLIRVYVDGDDLVIIAEGPAVVVQMFEVHVMSIVQELYMREISTPSTLSQAVSNLSNNLSVGVPFFDFGTRRRYSRVWHEYAVRRAYQTGLLQGTSNVYLAMRTGCPLIGTMGHELFQLIMGVSKIEDLGGFVSRTLEEWYEFYGPSLSIALTDILGSKFFWKSFSPELAKNYAGIRIDSGPLLTKAEEAIAEYAFRGVEAKEKKVVFSDGLHFEDGRALRDSHKNSCLPTICIGTGFTNDVGLLPIQIVFKMVAVNGEPVIKLADSPGKAMNVDQSHPRIQKLISLKNEAEGI